MSTYKSKNPPPDSINNSNEKPLFNFLSLLVTVSASVLMLYIFLHLFAKTLPYFVSLENEAKYVNLNFLFKSNDDTLIFEKNLSKSALSELTNDLWLNATQLKGFNFKPLIQPRGQENAFITPGAQIFLNQALIDNAQSENELSFVLCHELAHFHNRDTLLLLGTALTTGLLQALISNIGPGAEFPLIIQSIIHSKFNRTQELEADEFALNCLNKKYGHVNGYDAFFKRHQKNDVSLLKYSSSHPLSKDRIEKLNQLMTQNNFNPNGQLTPITGSL